MVTLDALLTFWLALALAAFLVAQHHRADERRQRAWMLVAWAATAGGVTCERYCTWFGFIPGAAIIRTTGGWLV